MLLLLLYYQILGKLLLVQYYAGELGEGTLANFLEEPFCLSKNNENISLVGNHSFKLFVDMLVYSLVCL